LNRHDIAVQFFQGFNAQGPGTAGPGHLQWNKMDASTQRWWVSYVLARLAPFANIIGYQFSWETPGNDTAVRRAPPPPRLPPTFHIAWVAPIADIILFKFSFVGRQLGKALRYCVSHVFRHRTKHSGIIPCILLHHCKDHRSPRIPSSRHEYIVQGRLWVSNIARRAGSVPPRQNLRGNECDSQESFLPQRVDVCICGSAW
jgi:hypothetical protein